jgi:hypothetical protein
MEMVHVETRAIKTRERSERSGFPLEKTTSNFEIRRVLRVLLNFCHRPAIRFGLRQDPRGRFRDPRFASFMHESNRKPLDSDFHDAVLKGRKLVKNVFRLGIGMGAAWIVIESAQALSVF